MVAEGEDLYFPGVACSFAGGVYPCAYRSGQPLPSMLLYMLEEPSEAQDLGQKRLPPIYFLVLLHFKHSGGKAHLG